MDTLYNILLDVFCISALISSLYYFPKTSAIIKNKIPKGKELFGDIMIYTLMLAGAVSLLSKIIL